MDATIDKAFLEFECEWCGVDVAVHLRCYRGQRYCSEACAAEGRRLSLLQAGAKYQKTESGRANHALRQQRYLERQAEKMTHQSSASEPGPLSREPVPSPVVATAPVERSDDDAPSSEQVEESHERAADGGERRDAGVRVAAGKRGGCRPVRCCCVCGLPIESASRAPPRGGLRWSFAG